MAKRKKSGNTMLRMEPGLHARVARTADTLGMSMNSLINLLIQSALPPFEDLAAVTTGMGTTTLLSHWLELNPGRELFEFYLDLDKLGWGKPMNGVPVPFKDGKWYHFGPNRQSFIEVEAPDPNELDYFYALYGTENASWDIREELGKMLDKKGRKRRWP